MRFREDWLDARLSAIAARIALEANLVADIGADHGRLACALLVTRPKLRMIVSDISADSLAKARRLLEERSLAYRAEFRVADGLRAIKPPESLDAVVLAGMGGATIRDILGGAGADTAIGEAKLILQPNKEAAVLREWLCTNSFLLYEETVVRANGRYYEILCAQRGESPALTPKQLALGPLLLKHRPPQYPDYLRWREQVLAHTLACLRIARERNASRETAIAQEIAWIKEERPWE